MTTRERTLSIVLVGFIVLALFGFAGYMFVYSPLQAKQRQTIQLKEEVAQLEDKLDAWLIPDKSKGNISRAQRLASMRQRSLPASEAETRRLTDYQRELEKILKDAKITGGAVNFRPSDNRSAPAPALAGKMPAFTKVAYTISFDKVPLKTIYEFLAAYDRIDLLHQITSMTIKRSDSNQTDNRADLSVNLITEALIMDGADPKRTPLFAPKPAPTLDYSALIASDVFHGPLPKLKVGAIPDMKIALGQAIPPIKVPLTGDVAAIGRTVLSTNLEKNPLLNADGVKIDPEGMAITLAPIKDGVGTAYVEVKALAADGRTAAGTIKLTVTAKVDEEPVVREPKIKEDPSFAVILVGVFTRSDGSALALVRDNNTRLNYEVAFSGKGVAVTRFRYLSPKMLKLEKDEKYGSGGTQPTLIITDEVTATDRAFRIVGMEHNALIVEELKSASKPVAAKWRNGPPGAAPAEPVAPVVTSNKLLTQPAFASVLGVPLATALPPPRLFRWESGQSLKALTEIPQAEVWKLLRTSSDHNAGTTAAIPAH